MIDPAVGRTRAMRALGEAYPGAKKKTVLNDQRSRVNEFRNTNVGMFAGPRPTYGRYNVSEQAADLLNRSKNKGTR